MKKKKMQEFKLQVPWGYVAAKAWGDESDTHVLIVHGILDNAGAFDRLIALLPDNFYYVCIDLPGHGLSSHMPPGIMLNYYNYILTIRFVLDQLKWNQTYYIGHSLGAHLGMFFSVLYPERITKLILLDGVIPKPFKNEDIIDRIRDEHNAAVEAIKAKNPNYYTKEEVLYALKNLRKCSLTTAAANALFERSVTKVGDDLYCYNRDFRARLSITPMLTMNQSITFLSKLKVETLIILVTSSLQFIKEIKADLQEAVKCYNHVNIVEVQGNHDVHNNYPERISDHISKFLNRLPSKL